MIRWLSNSLYSIGHHIAQVFGWAQPPERHAIRSLGQDCAFAMCQNATKVTKKLLDAGYETYLVGGCVRDIICGIEPKDFDIVTAATPDAIKKVFGRKARIIGRRFKIVHVMEAGDVIEVSTFRAKNSWWRSARQNNNIFGNLVQDVWRRDFSCNALYYDIEKEEVIDYVKGVDAIRRKTLEVLGDPVKRVEEDPVRMLRAIRFKAKTGFTIEKKLEDAIQKYGQLLEGTSSERMLVEVTKLFTFGHAAKAWSLLSDHQLQAVLFPGLKYVDEKMMSYYMRFILQTLYNTDNRYVKGQKISSSFLFSVLLWPAWQTKLSAHLKHTKTSRKSINLQQAMGYVFKEESKVVAIPKRLQEAIMIIWQLQSDFRRKFKQANTVVKNPRIRVGYDFLVTLAQIDEALVEQALKWQPFVEKAQKYAKKSNSKTTHE